jgi:hypothetical protein
MVYHCVCMLCGSSSNLVRIPIMALDRTASDVTCAAHCYMYKSVVLTFSTPISSCQTTSIDIMNHGRYMFKSTEFTCINHRNTYSTQWLVI